MFCEVGKENICGLGHHYWFLNMIPAQAPANTHLEVLGITFHFMDIGWAHRYLLKYAIIAIIWFTNPSK